MSDLPATRASDAEREEAVVRLREASAEGRLTLDEFTERMHAVYAARTHDELASLVQDLPSLPVLRATRERRALVVMGHETLDLRAQADDVSVRVWCVMGNVAVLVPRTARVELDAVALMGNKGLPGGAGGDPGGPLVRITGLVVMGNLEVRRA